jgi:hypothetical protein
LVTSTSRISLYAARVPAEADLVTYWFARARAHVEHGRAKRVGLLATQAIRGGANPRISERVQATCKIFWAQSDRPRVLDGAAVRISMVACDNGSEMSRTFDGSGVSVIHADLSSAANVASARPLKENDGICFMSVTKVGFSKWVKRMRSACCVYLLISTGDLILM